MDRQTMQYIAEDIQRRKEGEKLTAQLEATRLLLPRGGAAVVRKDSSEYWGDVRRAIMEEAALDNMGGGCAV